MNCEERYGHDAVERLLDGAHALMHQGVHRYPRPQSRDLKEAALREAERHAYQESIFNDLWRTLPRGEQPSAIPSAAAVPPAQLPLPQATRLSYLDNNPPSHSTSPPHVPPTTPP